MAEEQYDVSPKMRELFEKKQKMRNEAKQFWRKHLYNPYLQKQPFDPVLFRYTALSAYSTEHHRPSARRNFITFCFMAPFVIFTYLNYVMTNNREKKWRSGTVAYADRTEKLVY